MIAVGIDPGKTGATFWVDEVGFSTVIDMPKTVSGLLETLSIFGDRCHVFLEQQASRPKQSSVATFTHAKQYGEIIGILTALRVPFELVRPQVWTKAMGIPSGADKRVHVEKAQALYPDVQFTGPRGGLLDGRADACLLATYGQRVLAGRV